MPSAFPELGPMKVVRNELSRTRVAAPAWKPYAALAGVGGLGLLLFLNGISMAFVLPVDGTQTAGVLIGLGLSLFGGFTTLIATMTAVLASRRTLWFDFTPDRLMVQHITTWQASWTDIQHVDVRRVNQTKARLRVRCLDGGSVAWTVFVGNGRGFPTIQHYDALADTILKRAHKRENLPDAVPSNLRRMKTSKVPL